MVSAVKDKYQEIAELRKETITEDAILTACLRKYLHRKFENRLAFTKATHRQGVFIA